MEQFVFKTDLKENPKDRKIRFRAEMIEFCILNGITARDEIRKILGVERKTVCTAINTVDFLKKYSGKDIKLELRKNKHWDGKLRMDLFNMCIQLANTALGIYQDKRKETLRNQIKNLERKIVDEESKHISKRDQRVIDCSKRELYLIFHSITRDQDRG